MDVFRLSKLCAILLLLFNAYSAEYTLKVIDRVKFDESKRIHFIDTKIKDEQAFEFKGVDAKIIDGIRNQNKQSLEDIIDYAALDNCTATPVFRHVKYLFCLASHKKDDISHLYINENNFDLNVPVLYSLKDKKGKDIIPEICGKITKGFAKENLETGLKFLSSLKVPVYAMFAKTLSDCYNSVDLSSISRIDLRSKLKSCLNQDHMLLALLSIAPQDSDDFRIKTFKENLNKALFRVVDVGLLCVD